MKKVRDFNVTNKRVLVRCDYNVPLNERGNILNDFRIKRTLPTIEYLIKNKAKVILISHLGRPKSWNMEHGTWNKEFSLRPIALRLEKLLKKKVKFLDDCLGERVEKEIERMRAGDIILLENLRFYKEEEKNSPEFAKKLSNLGDIFIQEGFGVCHRKHSSVIGIPKYLPSGIGLLVEQEIKVLTKLRDNPKKPLVIIIGGKKAETKGKLINKILKRADKVLIGHLIEKEIKEKNIKLKFLQKIINPIDGLPKGKNLDIGPKTIDLFSKKISQAKTIFWNGQLGYTEDKKFAKGSLEIAKAIIKSKAHSIVGGGDTIAFLGQNNLRGKFNFVSTGGGAMLAFLSSEKLPGLEILRPEMKY